MREKESEYERVDIGKRAWGDGQSVTMEGLEKVTWGAGLKGFSGGEKSGRRAQERGRGGTDKNYINSLPPKTRGKERAVRGGREYRRRNREGR